MPKTTNPWTTVSLHPLQGQLDTRSRPAEVPAGGFRWKQNFSISSEGKLCRRGGHQRFSLASLSGANCDYHQQRKTREPITLLFESTASDGSRRLCCGTESTFSVLEWTTGLWTDIFTGLGSGTGSRFRAAELADTIIVTNNWDDVRYYQYVSPTHGTAASGTISDLTGILYVSKAKLVVAFSGFILLMNVVQDGKRQGGRIIWSDLNNSTSFDPAAKTVVPHIPTDTDPSVQTTTYTISGFQDLDYGDDILAAAPMLGALYVYTRRSIWRVAPSGDSSTVFTFNKVYSEPKNQTGCLAYENTLVSTGTEHWFLGRDGIYNYNPYIATPERQDWLHRASGLIYRKVDTQLDSLYCQSPIGEYSPDTRELWISWPTTADAGINSMTLVAQVEQKTADVIDEGFTALANFRKTADPATGCDVDQNFVGASSVDWCIKDIGGGVFSKEYVVLTDPADLTVDIALAATYRQDGYDSILRGLIPLGFNDRDKIIRNVLVDLDVAAQDVPCVVRLRIGNAHTMLDPNDPEADWVHPTDPKAFCAPLWRLIRYSKTVENPPLSCPDQMSLAAMVAANLRSAIGMEWPCYEQGRFLFFELTILNADGSPAIGGDVCLQRIDFDALALPKR